MKRLILRTCSADMTSHNGFVWPRSGYVEAPDWEPTAECGHGLHGFLDGQGDGDLANWSPDAVWIVAEIDDYIDLGGKVKFRSANVIYAGDRKTATDYFPGAGVIGAFRTSGDNGTSTSGDNGTSTSGTGGTSTSSRYGTSTSGDFGTSTSGDNGTSTSGDGGTSTSGDFGTSTSGYGGKARAGIGGVIRIDYYDNRRRTLIGYIGEDGLEPDTFYRVEDGKFVKA